MKKLRAITLIEIVISTTIMSLLLVGGFTMILKKSKVLKASSNEKNITFICHKGIGEGNSANLFQTTITGINAPVTANATGDYCQFNIPEGYSEYKVTVIGGGSGGSSTSIIYNWENNEETITDVFKNSGAFYSTLDDAQAEELITKHKKYEKDKVFNASLPGLFNKNKNAFDKNYKLNKLEFGALSKVGMSTEQANEIYKKIPILIKSGASSKETVSNKKIVYCKYTPDLNIGDSYLYFDGQPSATSDAISTQDISPSAGYFIKIGVPVNDSPRTISKKYDYAIDLDSEDEANCKNSSEATDTTLNKYNYIELKYDILKGKIYHGANGANAIPVGPFVIDKKLIAGKTLTIKKENIGNGGLAGNSCTNTTTNCLKETSGKDGTRTTFELEGFETITAYGAYATQATENEITEHQANSNTLGELDDQDDYINTVQNFDDETIKANLKAKSFNCTNNNTSNNCANSVSPSNNCFGCGGAGSQGYIDSKQQYCSYSYKTPATGSFIKVTSEQDCNNIVKTATASSGMGGAIIIECRN